jgi:hypothetical protein
MTRLPAFRLRLCAAGLLAGLLAVLGGAAPPARAQSAPALQLAVHRDWGYGGGDQIQGLFSLEAIGPDDLASATFMIDGQVLATITAAPFKVQFDTGRYPLGWHSLRLTGKTAGGATLSAPDRRLEFVDASVGLATAGRLGGTILGGVAIVFVLVVGLQLFLTRGGKRRTLPLGAARRYGLKGGAVCPKCGRPFSIHFLSLNALTGFVDRCDHCGRWGFVRRASPEQLAAAEQAELAMARPAGPLPMESEAEKLKRQLDDSRYSD